MRKDQVFDEILKELCEGPFGTIARPLTAMVAQHRHGPRNLMDDEAAKAVAYQLAEQAWGMAVKAMEEQIDWTQPPARTSAEQVVLVKEMKIAACRGACQWFLDATKPSEAPR